MILKTEGQIILSLLKNLFFGNDLLSFKCSVNNFHFITQSSGWTLNNCALDSLLYYSDDLHLVKRGNLKLGNSFLKAMDSAITGPRITIPYKKCNVLHRFQFKS